MEHKEHLLHFFLQGKVNLSQYDQKFMHNLQMLIHNNKRVTTNQAALFDNLVSKYTKQLTKLDLAPETLNALLWKTMVVKSTSDYTGAVVTIIEDQITIRVPFNKKFISEFSSLANNTFLWNKEDKLYRAPFSTEALKIAVTRLDKYFDTVQFCENTKSILDQLKPYESATIWNPTLVGVHGNLIVAACNPVIGKLISDMDLTLDAKTLYQLSTYGIKVDPELLVDEKLAFSASNVAEVDLEDIEPVIDWMKEIGCTHAMLGRGMHGPSTTIKHMLDNKNIIPVSYAMMSQLPTEANIILLQMTSYTFPNMLVNKIVVIKDSTPVDVR